MSFYIDDSAIDDAYNEAIANWAILEPVKKSNVPFLSDSMLNTARKISTQFFNAKYAYDLNDQPTWLDSNGELINGIYLGMPNDVYHDLPCLNSSKLKCFAKSPAHYYREYVQNKGVRSTSKQQQATFDLGSYTHELILEGDVFYSRHFKLHNKKEYPDALHTIAQLKEYCKANGLGTDGSRIALIQRIILQNAQAPVFEHMQLLNIKDNVSKQSFDDAMKKAEEALKKRIFTAGELLEHASDCLDKNPIEAQLWDKAHDSLAVVRKDDYANAILQNGQPEVTVIADCPLTTYKLKVRFDWLTNDGLPVDLKTTRTCEFRKLSYQFLDLRYDLQAAFYMYVGKLAGLPLPDIFPFVCVESNEADIAEVILLDDADMAFAHQDCQLLLERLKHCLDTKNWYGFSEHGATVLRLPRRRNT